MKMRLDKRMVRRVADVITGVLPIEDKFNAALIAVPIAMGIVYGIPLYAGYRAVKRLTK